MKNKISATIDGPLLSYLDSLPGRTRSEKLERVLRAFQRFEEDRELRRQLGASVSSDMERAERESWQRTFSESMWSD